MQIILGRFQAGAVWLAAALQVAVQGIYVKDVVEAAEKEQARGGREEARHRPDAPGSPAPAATPSCRLMAPWAPGLRRDPTRATPSSEGY